MILSIYEFLREKWEMFSDQYNAAVKEMELAEISKDNMRINRCPNCETVEAYVADHCNYVICRQCHMTGPVGHSDEEAVELWNSLPRRGEVVVTTHKICGRCGCEIVPGLVHYCMPEIEEQAENRAYSRMYQAIGKG